MHAIALAKDKISRNVKLSLGLCGLKASCTSRFPAPTQLLRSFLRTAMILQKRKNTKLQLTNTTTAGGRGQAPNRSTCRCSEFVHAGASEH